MNTVRAVLFGILAILMATAAYAQKPGCGSGSDNCHLPWPVCHNRSTPVPFAAVRFRWPGSRDMGTCSATGKDVAANRSAAENPLP